MGEPYRYRPRRFFGAVYFATWLPWLLAVALASSPGAEGYLPLLNLLGLLAPIVTSMVFIATSGSPALKADFGDRLYHPRRLSPVFVLLAIVLPFAVTLSAVWLSIIFGHPADQLSPARGPLLPIILLTMVLAPIMEEVGWHGYGVDSLRARHGTLKATLLFGILWSAWHAPLALIPGSYQHTLAGTNPAFLANFFISIVPAAIVANWIYYHCDRSIAAAVLTHSMLNAAAVLINAGQVAKCFATLLYALIAVLVVAFDRVFREGPWNFPRA